MPAVDVMFDDATYTTHYQLDTLLEDWSYYRFQPWLKEASDSMEDCSPENISGLKQVVHNWVEGEIESGISNTRNKLDRAAQRVNRLHQCCSHLMDNIFRFTLEALSKKLNRNLTEIENAMKTIPDQELSQGFSESRGAVAYSDEALKLLSKEFGQKY